MDIYVTRIQKIFRGYLYRSRRLPLILYIIQRRLSICKFNFVDISKDGRTNSCLDENNIIDMLLNNKFFKIKIPNIRMWYDILIYDNIHGWIPVNIKSTTTFTNDNAGNLAMCVHSYTNYKLDLFNETKYNNNFMSSLLIKKLKLKEYNRLYKKDYYFIVFNKTDPKDIIVNSILGLANIYPNINNLPFQVCWNKNREFIYDRIDNKVNLFIECLQKPMYNWKNNFLRNIKIVSGKMKRKRQDYMDFVSNKKIKLD